VGATTADGSLGVVYIPESREITIDLAQLAGPLVEARWYDPSDGRFAAVAGSPFRADGTRRLRPEADTNSAGFADWVLILRSSS
jgi:hypothetical protein